VREALNLAVDRAEIAQAIFAGHAEPAAIRWGCRGRSGRRFKVTPDMMYATIPRARRSCWPTPATRVAQPRRLRVPAPRLPEGKAFAEAMGGYWRRSA